jgi:hypothetical protein
MKISLEVKLKANIAERKKCGGGWDLTKNLEHTIQVV